MDRATWESRIQTDKTLMVTLTGEWKAGRLTPFEDDISSLLNSSQCERIRFDSKQLKGWDSSLVVFLSLWVDHCAPLDIAVEQDGLPEGARHLFALSRVVPPKTNSGGTMVRRSLLSRVGEMGINAFLSVRDTTDFLKELVLSFARMVAGKARVRSLEILQIIESCGWKALPIVSLISFLVGLILAFMGAVQLQMFGAQIYVADLVGIGMAREMGAVMTGVIMAGRTGAAFAANIGTMQVNEEIDALRTLGISPMDFLVLPRMVAMVLMMPLLCMYSIFMGLAGGTVVGGGAFDISVAQYLTQTCNALTFTHIGIGIFKSMVFGFIVAFCGCMQGMYCGRSAAAVGDATTSAVVIAIVYIVVADGIFAVLTNVLGI